MEKSTLTFCKADSLDGDIVDYYASRTSSDAVKPVKAKRHHKE
jgi:hypothetical protein